MPTSMAWIGKPDADRAFRLWQRAEQRVVRRNCLFGHGLVWSASVESVTADSERGGQPAEDPELVQEPDLEIFQRVWTLVTAARDAGETSQLLAVAHAVAEMMGPSILEGVDIEALREDLLRRVSEMGQDVRGQDLRVKAGVAAVAGTASNVSVATGSLEIVRGLSAQAAREGIAHLTKLDVLTLVLVWLLMIGAPVLQRFLPPEDQTVMSNEYATVALGLAITGVGKNPVTRGHLEGRPSSACACRKPRPWPAAARGGRAAGGPRHLLEAGTRLPWSGGTWRGPRPGDLCCSFPPLAWFMLPIVAALPQMVITRQVRGGR